MIKSSIYFLFDNESSENYKILNVTVDSGLYSEPFSHSRSILETQVRHSDKPIFQGTKSEPISLPLTLAFDADEVTDDDIQAVKRWLIKPYYKPLIFSDNLDYVYYAMFVDASEYIHNGITGYINVTVRFDSAHYYSPTFKTEWYDLRTNMLDGTEIIFENKGGMDCKPTIYISKYGDGDISIENLSDGGYKMEITDLVDGEELEVICENGIINTSLNNTYRIDNVTDYQFMTIPYGKNRLLVRGNCYIQFEYEYKFL